MLNALNRVQFDLSDIIRRAQGDMLGALGLDPNECSYQTIVSHAHWRLRDYGGEDRSRSLLIVASCYVSVSDSDTFPGSLLSYASALAFPGTFVWSRLTDAVISIADPLAMEIHARVERWALDEISLPGKLVHQIVDWLYRENRFFRGVLKINGKFVGPSTLSVANLALINTADDVAPPISVKPFADAIERKVRIIEYPSERGVCLQHLGILVGRYAQGHIWPKILSWLKSQK